MQLRWELAQKDFAVSSISDKQYHMQPGEKDKEIVITFTSNEEVDSLDRLVVFSSVSTLKNQQMLLNGQSQLLLDASTEKNPFISVKISESGIALYCTGILLY